ncbi:MAG TPA: protoporphyrinogen oxidase, partial [Bacillota bacterium]|nr:protoporphyrinogen oxidase [Bacillota bacterium]
GGKLKTIRQDGFTIERGADSFLARKKPGIKLMEELGLVDELIYNETGQAYVYSRGGLHAIPAGSYMGIPVANEPFINSELLSEAGKQRVLEEVSIPKGSMDDDQSLGTFLRRRFGDELVENMLEPLLSGIYSSDIDDMGLLSTFPRFHELEQEYGSVLRGLRATMPTQAANTGKKPGQFVSLNGGLGRMVDTLVDAIGPDIIHTEKDVQRIARSHRGYELSTADGSRYEADRVLLAVPHRKVTSLFENVSWLNMLDDIPVSSVVNVVMGFDAGAVERHLDGTGFVVSRNSDLRITACTWVDRKWPHMTPDGKVLLRVYAGKPNDQAIVTLPNDEVISIVLADLRHIMTIDSEPDFAVVSRWEKQMPQYTTGHSKMVSTARTAIQENVPGIYLAGSSYDGVGIPDCIGSAESAVEQIRLSLS